MPPIWRPASPNAGQLGSAVLPGRPGRGRHVPPGRPVGAAGRSLPIPLRARPGTTLRDFATGWRGDDLDLLAEAIGGDSKAAHAEAVRFLGIAGKVTPRPAPAAAPPVRNDRNQLRAQALWRQAHPLCWCSTCEPGRRYLTSRNIAAWPEALFFHPRCPSPAGIGAALLAPVNCHRTHLVVECGASASRLPARRSAATAWGRQGATARGSTGPKATRW